jgi:hypothetical protein
MTAINEETLYAVIVKRCLLLVAFLALAGFIGFSSRVGLGILAGGIIAVLNFFWMRNTLQRILGMMPENPARYGFIRYMGRMTVMGFALYYVLTSSLFSVAGLLVGLSVVVLNIMYISLSSALRTGG